jgi:hypothetical protein
MFNNVQGNSPSRPSQEAPPSKLMDGGGASIRVKGNGVACAKGGGTRWWAGPQNVQGTYPMLG